MTPDETMAALNVLCKWRNLFAGWQLGTRAKGDPEGDAVRDHREITILLRAELTALTGLLIEKGLVTAAEFDEALGNEAVQLNHDYEGRFPGVTASLSGLHFDLAKIQQAGWMRRWKP